MTELCHLVKRLRGKEIKPLNMKRASIKVLQARLVTALHIFLQRQAVQITGQIIVLRSKFGKADLSQDELDQLEHIVAGIDFSGWAVLAGEVEPFLAELGKDNGLAALIQVHINVEARPEIVNVVNKDALIYANRRSAELVGMRRDALGRLVVNHRAEWAITDATRDYLRGVVAKSLQEGWSNDRLAKEIRESEGFSANRAMTIARTETIMASNTGSLNAYKASGVVDGKIWTTAEDDRVSEECEANADQGVIPLDEPFSSGDDAPPVHPNCRCAVAPFIDWQKSANAEQSGVEES